MSLETAAPSAGKVLLVDDDENLSRVMSRELSRTGFTVASAANSAVCRMQLRQDDFDVILLDLRLGAEDGLEVLRSLRADGINAEVIMLTGQGSIPTAVEAIRLGARDYLTKPCDLTELEVHLRKAVETHRVEEENYSLRQYLAGGEAEREFVTRDAAVLRLLDSLTRVAASDAPVLIQGESGTGKELIARRLHSLSPDPSTPFVTVNCAVLRTELLESELFGHERGAFTGAVRRKKGLFEIASGGTIFLDEIGEIEPSIQAKLLRVLQFGELRRVGGTESIHVQVRVVAATNRDLEKEAEEGRFREDLFFRLNVLPLRLPPLRERPEDVGPLLEHFLRLHSGPLPQQLTPEAIEVLRRYSWPGNVRELENVVQRLLVFHQEGSIGEDMIRAALPRIEERENMSLLTLDDVEKQHILRVLLGQSNNKRETAKVLGISLKTLYNKLHRYGEM